jgi:ribose transport system permease protein
MKSLTKFLGNSNNTILYLCLLYYLLAAISTPGFFTINNSWNLLYNLMPLLIVATGQTLVILTAGIDLSITSIIAVCSVVGGIIMSSDYTPFENETYAMVFGILAMIAVGALIGLINGISVARFKMPAFMVTLTGLMFFSGFAVWLTKSQNIYNLPPALVNMPYTNLLGLPIPFWIGLLVLALTYLTLNKSLLGEWIYAVGTNPKTSRISGVNVNFTIVMAYVLSGISAAIGSLLYTARLETGSPVMGQNLLLDVIGAVVIGGTSLFGGKGLLQWTIAGALFMVMLDNSLNLAGMSYFLIMIVKGIIILWAALLNVVRDRKVAVSV